MGKNAIRLLGFLGFLGLLGIYTKNYGFFGFFGFFSFFVASVKNDERLERNVYKAGFYSFIVGLIGVNTLIVGLSLKSGIALLSIIISVVFILMLLTFIISLGILDKKGT